jgi:hypothetical protein
MHSFEVLDQLLAARIDVKPTFTRLVAEHRVHTIESVFDRRIRPWDLTRGLEELMLQEVLHDLPVGA